MYSLMHYMIHKLITEKNRRNSVVWILWNHTYMTKLELFWIYFFNEELRLNIQLARLLSIQLSPINSYGFNIVRL